MTRGSTRWWQGGQEEVRFQMYFKVGPTRFADGLDVRCERRGKDDSKVFSLG